MAPPSKSENRCSVPGAQLVASRIGSPKCWRPTRAADFAETRPGIFPAPDRSFSAGCSRVGTTECESGIRVGSCRHARKKCRQAAMPAFPDPTVSRLQARHPTRREPREFARDP